MYGGLNHSSQSEQGERFLSMVGTTGRKFLDPRHFNTLTLISFRSAAADGSNENESKQGTLSLGRGEIHEAVVFTNPNDLQEVQWAFDHHNP